MSKIKGTVTGCGKGKFSYFIVLDSKEGFYFNTKYEPKCGKGDVVGIEYEQKAENRGNVKRVEVLESNSSGYEDTSKAASSGSYSSGGGGGGGGRQDSIVWQSSRKDALVFAGLLVSEGVKGFKLAGKPDARRTQVEELVDEITARFFEDASDPRACKAMTSNAAIEDDTPDDDTSDDAWDDSSTSGGEWED